MGIYLRFQKWLVMLMVTAVLSIIFIMVFSHGSVVASEWSWTEASPSIAESTTVTDISGQSTCAHEYNLVHVVGEQGNNYVCRNSDGPIKVGTYYTGDHYQYSVGFSSDDSTMYKLYAIGCERYNSCVYVPDTDTLVTLQNYTSGAYWLMLYKNFSKNLVRTVNTTTFNIEFTFSVPSPDYTFTNSHGIPWQVGGIGASPNGKWIAVEFKQRGIGLLNTETFGMRRISALHFEYGLGHNPQSELAVTNDGKHVAVMGYNAGIAEFEVTDGCGEEVTDLVMFSIDYVSHACKSAPINRFSLIQGFLSALHPHFENDGAELGFYVQAYSGEQREVILQAAGYSGPRMDYLALGDSFTSGEGETDDSFYNAGTNVEFEKCHVSSRSYPYLIASSLHIEPQYIRSIACSGATMGDVVGEDKNYWGQIGRLDSGHLNLDTIQKTLAQTAAKENFIPGRVHQLQFVSRYRPKIITIGIGGNDAGFMDKLKTCIGIDTCEWATSKRYETALEVARIFPTLVNTYTNLHVVSPSSKIYVVGYPKIIDQNGTCSYLNNLLLNETERIFMNEGIEYINKIIETAAEKAGVTYIDNQDVLGGHVLCGSSAHSYINGVTLGDDEGINDQIKWPKIIAHESFHPQPEAHKMIFERIMATIPNLLTYQHCPNNVVVCPVELSFPRVPSYWSDYSSLSADRRQQASRFTDNAFDNKHPDVNISLSDYSLQPGSAVTIELHSDPRVLGTSLVDDVGGLSKTLQLAVDTSEGYHAIHILGTSYTGDPIDYYQVISYVSIAADNESPDIQQAQGTTSQLEHSSKSLPSDSLQVAENESADGSYVNGSYKDGKNVQLASSSLANNNNNRERTIQTPLVIDTNSYTWIVLGVVVAISVLGASIVYILGRRGN